MRPWRECSHTRIRRWCPLQRGVRVANDAVITAMMLTHNDGRVEGWKGNLDEGWKRSGKRRAAA